MENEDYNYDQALGKQTKFLFVAFLVFPVMLLYCLFTFTMKQRVFAFWLLLLASAFILYYHKENGLDKALAGAATKDKTVIITVVNEAYTRQRMLDMFWYGFLVGDNTQSLTDNILVVAVDQRSYYRCKSIFEHCYRLETAHLDFSRERVYSAEDSVNMLLRRTLFLRDVLKLGYNFIFTDTDVLWLRNPIPMLLHSQDLQFSAHKFSGNQSSEEKFINTGFYMVKSNKKTISLFNEWHSGKHNIPGLKEQDVLQNLMEGGLFRKLGLKVTFLDTIHFSSNCGGSNDVQTVITVHAHCNSTTRAKIKYLRAVLDDWEHLRTYLEDIFMQSMYNYD